MPALYPDEIAQLLREAVAPRHCHVCGCWAGVRDYCRSCDEFYWIFSCGCSKHAERHHGHRLTLVPYVEDRWR